MGVGFPQFTNRAAVPSHTAYLPEDDIRRTGKKPDAADVDEKGYKLAGDKQRYLIGGNAPDADSIKKIASNIGIGKECEEFGADASTIMEAFYLLGHFDDNDHMDVSADADAGYINSAAAKVSVPKLDGSGETEELNARSIRRGIGGLLNKAKDGALDADEKKKLSDYMRDAARILQAGIASRGLSKPLIEASWVGGLGSAFNKDDAAKSIGDIRGHAKDGEGKVATRLSGAAYRFSVIAHELSKKEGAGDGGARKASLRKLRVELAASMYEKKFPGVKFSIILKDDAIAAAKNAFSDKVRPPRTVHHYYMPAKDVYAGEELLPYRKPEGEDVSDDVRFKTRFAVYSLNAKRDDLERDPAKKTLSFYDFAAEMAKLNVDKPAAEVIV
ncbi:MAG: hypothetical protein LBI39_00170 [Puniceicoccales bacterium]|nr:hypothetical protein [Puniceicoccales bacterium]